MVQYFYTNFSIASQKDHTPLHERETDSNPMVTVNDTHTY